MDSISLLQAEAGPTPPNLPKNDKCKEKYQEEYDFLSHTARGIHENFEGQIPFPSQRTKQEREKEVGDSSALHCTALGVFVSSEHLCT